MKEAVVVGKATGQRAAINPQINSNTIVNVISKEKRQELPIRMLPNRWVAWRVFRFIGTRGKGNRSPSVESRQGSTPLP